MSSFGPTSPSNRVRIVVATSVMLTFISYWRAAAIVLNDLSSSAFYACGIAEQAVGKSAPWFIVAVMLFLFTGRGAYVVNVSMFFPRGVFKGVKRTLGSAPAPPKGIQESSEKALRVMQITTVMVVILMAWSVFTLLKAGYNPVPLPTPQNLHFSRESLGFLSHSFPEQDIAKMFGLLGILIAFGHSVLAMSGEESLAQVNRELAHPKLKNLKKAAIVIAIYSFVFTGLSALLSVMLIPDAVRVPVYKDNLISGLAMYMWGPLILRLVFRAFVVVVGFLILSGAVNTAIIGSNGVLNRVSEDGVLADWFRVPHRK